jgi:hypothetical protein
MRIFLLLILLLLLRPAMAAGPLFKHSDTQGPEKTGFGHLFKKVDAPANNGGPMPAPAAPGGEAAADSTPGETAPAEGTESSFTPGMPASNSIAPDEDSAGKAASQREFENVYHDISYPKISTGTAQNFTIVNGTITRLSANTISVSSLNVTGTFIVNGSSQIGRFIQVISSATTKTFSTTSTSYQATGLKVTITPTAATSNVLCWASFTCLTSELNQDFCFATLERGGSNLSDNNGFAIFTTGSYAAGQSFQVPYALNYFDSPATTSATTYEIYIRTSAGAATATLNNNRHRVVITCAEIGA